MIKTHPQSVQRGAGSTSRHGGAVIVVVLALMAMLAFLGLFFFEFASEQYNTSENFASVEDVDIDPELTFNEILQQTVVGTTNQQSVLDGGTWSLLSSILGKPNSNLQFNVSPYTGSGIAVGYDPTGLGSVTFDYNNDGTADTFIVNFSRSQQPGMSPTYPTAMSQFEPNAGYIYPDINSLFLGFDGYTFDRFGSGAKYHHVVIPSYFRPQYFRSFRGDATSMTPANYAGIYTTGTTALQVLHPHRDHKAWTGSAGGASRFLNTATQAVSGDQSRRIQPFPFVVDRHSPTSPTTTRLGIFTDHSLSITGGRQEYDYEYDADADADGQSDAILMDLGLPLINLPRGRQVVPLTFIKWTDGDGLLSLNSAGNLTALRFYGTPFNGAAPTPNNPQFGQSNFGRSRAEMNLAWALYANPRNTAFLATADIEDVTRQQFFATTVQFHGTLTGQADLFRHPFMANVEMAALLAGRYPYRNSGTTPFKPLGDQSPLLGRWGDDYTNTLAFEGYLQGMNGSATLTWPTTPPGAGKPGATDDTDVWYPSYGGQFGQPADPLGRGSLVNPTVTAHGYVRAMANVGAGPVRLPFNVGTWPTSAYPAALHEAVGNFGFDDEASEGFPDKVLNPDDRPFGPEEALALHGSAADLQRAGVLSRAVALAPFNLRDNLQADVIRKQFTPESWDRLESGAGRYEATKREYNAWRTGGSAYTVGTEQFNSVFPPMFSAGGVDVDVFSATDPFRQPVRQILAKRIDDGATDRMSASDWASRKFLGRRLNINRLAEDVDVLTGMPIYRELRPHPTGIAATPVVFGDSSDEDLARRDRQRMARDIYVLLYMVSNATTLDPATTSNAVTGGSAPTRTRAIYDDVVLKEMAQFAVNVVDSLDPDDRMTRFEYDMDLSNGWNLDDDAYSSTGDTATADRDIVIGVETQQLTLSEAMFVYCLSGTDKTETEWNDGAERSFAYMELRNSTPFNIDMSGGHWKVQVEATGTVPYKREAIVRNAADPTLNQYGVYTIGTAGDDHNQNAGVPRDSFMKVDVGMPMGTMTRIVPAPGTPAPVSDTAALNLDLVKDVNSNFEVKREDVATTVLGDFFPPAMAKDLYDASIPLKVTLWRRQDPHRVTPTAANAATQDFDNPWVQVDEMQLERDEGFVAFNPGGTLLTEVEKLKSWERAQPLHRYSKAGVVTGGGERKFTLPDSMAPDTGQICNSIASDNQASQPTSSTPAGLLDNGFTLWQPHFDRDFNSIYDLLMVPLFGPENVTSLLARGPGSSPRISGFATISSIRQPVLAGGIFLEPEHSTNLQQMTPTWQLNKRWYRLLELLEVESEDLKSLDRWSLTTGTGSGSTVQVVTGTGNVFRAGDVITISSFANVSFTIQSVAGDTLTLESAPAGTWAMGDRVTAIRRKWREPGRVNLNTLRSEAVLAAMIDDASIARLPVDFTNFFTTDSMLTASTGAIDRNWYLDLIASRDGIDPVKGLPIPGSPTGSPFRSLSAVKYRAAPTTPDGSREQTILRKGGGINNAVSSANLQTIQQDPSNTLFPGLGVFEARSFGDLDSTSANSEVVDFATRHRLLSKVGNHSTTRSHLYFGWIGVQYHESHQLSSGEVQIGARAEDLPIQRMFVVIDMTRLEEAYDSTSQTFDWRKFVIYRQRLE